MGKHVGIQPQQFKKVRVGSHWSDIVVVEPTFLAFVPVT